MKGFTTAVAIIIAIFVIAIVPIVSFAGNYPPATPGITPLNLDYWYGRTPHCSNEFEIDEVSVFIYDTDYNIEKSLDGQVVRGVVRLTAREGDSGTVDFQFYGKSSDTNRSYNRVVFLTVPGCVSSAKIEEKIYSWGDMPVRERTLVVKLCGGEYCEGCPLEPTATGEIAESPYIELFMSKKTMGDKPQSNASQ